jgi:hypothetical protein
MPGKESQAQETSSKSPKLEVWSKGELMVGKTSDGRQINNLDPKLEGKLEVAQQLPLGSQIQGLEDLSVVVYSPVSGKAETVFATDKEGKIEKNISTAPQSASSQRLQSALERLNSPEIKALTQMVKNLSLEVRQQQAMLREQQEINQKLRAVNINIVSALKQQDSLLERRIQSKDPAWWQKATQKFQEFGEAYQQRRQQQTAAYTLVKLWDKEAGKKAEIYRGTNYTIERKGVEYTVRWNKDNQIVLQFERTPVNGVIIRNSELTAQDEAEIMRLKQALKQNRVDGGFATLSAQWEYRNQQTERIASGLVDLARQQSQGKFLKEGQAYNIYAEASGEVKIWRQGAENPELIYERSAQNQFNKMSGQDISVLSQALADLKQPKVAQAAAPVPPMGIIGAGGQKGR